MGVLQVLTCQLACQLAGGPEIKLRFGRKDAEQPEGCAPEGNLPGVTPCPPSGSALIALR